MAKILSYIGISVLVVIAIVLGYTIIQQPPNQQSTPQVPTNNSATQQNLPSAKEQALVKAIPGPNATQEEKAKFFADLDTYGVETDTIVINNCKPSPALLKIKKGTNFRVTNEDVGERTLGIGEKVVVIKSKETVIVGADWDGAKGFHCGTSIVGIIYVI